MRDDVQTRILVGTVACSSNQVRRAPVVSFSGVSSFVVPAKPNASRQSADTCHKARETLMGLCHDRFDSLSGRFCHTGEFVKLHQPGAYDLLQSVFTADLVADNSHIFPPKQRFEESCLGRSQPGPCAPKRAQ